MSLCCHSSFLFSLALVVVVLVVVGNLNLTLKLTQDTQIELLQSKLVTTPKPNNQRVARTLPTWQAQQQTANLPISQLVKSSTYFNAYDYAVTQTYMHNSSVYKHVVDKSRNVINRVTQRRDAGNNRCNCYKSQQLDSEVIQVVTQKGRCMHDKEKMRVSKKRTRKGTLLEAGCDWFHIRLLHFPKTYSRFCKSNLTRNHCVLMDEQSVGS